MSDTLREMMDHHQIRKLLSEYCNACDRCDRERMAGVYSDDGWDDHGARSGSGVDFARTVTDEMEHIRSVSHMLGQSTISVQDDEAGAETYFFAVLRVANERGEEVIHQLGGRFVDRLVRDGETWKIKHRTALRDWSITLPVEADFIAQQGLTEGSRIDDLCFAALGIRHSGIPAFAKTLEGAQ